jgi:DNA-binding transcriptional LysR family regulator
LLLDIHSPAADNRLPRKIIIELNSQMKSTEDMLVFAQVVERASFSAAAESLGITPSAASKIVTRLEQRLGVRLLHRTTRRLSLTPEGEIYHRRARDILAAIDEAEIEISRAQTPHGRLRINSFVTFSLQHIAPVLPDFFARYPKVEIELTVTDRIVDLLADNADVAIRTGTIDDPSLVVRKIAHVERGIFASPQYLARRGTPRNSDQLAEHDCIKLTSSSAGHRWLFQEEGVVKVFDIKGRITVDNTETALQLALAGVGIVRLGDMVVGNAVRDGRLIQLLSDCHVVEPIQLSAIYPLGRQHLPKVRAFIDFLVERFKHAPWRTGLVSAQHN